MIMSSSSTKKRPRSDEYAMEIKSRNDKAVETMLDRLDAIESCSDPSQVRELATQASTTLLDLKSIQRTVLTKLKEANSALQEKRAEMETQSMILQSLDYEKTYLENQIGAQVSTPHLERMCREESQTRDDDTMSKEEIMNAFLCGNKTVSFDDPSNYQISAYQTASRNQLERLSGTRCHSSSKGLDGETKVTGTESTVSLGTSKEITPNGTRQFATPKVLSE